METIHGLVSIIMSNYNTPEEYLREAIESVLSQTYQKFEFIIIDDCSTDRSLDIIESYSDERIILIKNEKNLGITKSLNRGLNVARGEFVARMDSDDICVQNRIEKQVLFLKEHPQFIVCGTAIELIGDWEETHKNNIICREIPQKEEFQIYLLFGNYPNMVHPTAMFNHQLLLENKIIYDERYPYAQDYCMWVNCSRYGECANIPEVLLKYRVHNRAVSQDKREEQKNCTIQIMQEQLKKLNIELSDADKMFHTDFLYGRKQYHVGYKQWIKRIIRQNRKYCRYNHKMLKKILWDKWAEITYFGLRNEKTFGGRIKILIHFPIIHLPKLFELKIARFNNQK